MRLFPEPEIFASLATAKYKYYTSLLISNTIQVLEYGPGRQRKKIYTQLLQNKTEKTQKNESTP